MMTTKEKLRKLVLHLKTMPDLFWFKVLDIAVCLFGLFVTHYFGYFLAKSPLYETLVVFSFFGVLVVNTGLISNYFCHLNYYLVDSLYTVASLLSNSAAVTLLLHIWRRDDYIVGEPHVVFLIVHVQLLLSSNIQVLLVLFKF